MGRRGIQGAILKALGAHDHRVAVTAVESVGVKCRRIRFRSDTLLEGGAPGPGAWLRMWFPDPEDPKVEHQRGYTMIRVDAAAGEFSVDFVLHESAGPASTWAAGAEVGQELAVMTYGSQAFTVPADTPEHYVLVGDATSLPALREITAAIPDHVPVTMYYESHCPEDADLPMPRHPLLTLHHIERTGPDALADTVSRACKTGDVRVSGHAWVACERESLKRVRHVLTREMELSRAVITSRAYWTETVSGS